MRNPFAPETDAEPKSETSQPSNTGSDGLAGTAVGSSTPASTTSAIDSTDDKNTEQTDESDETVRRGRGDLESDVAMILTKLSSGSLALEDAATPHRIAKLVVEDLGAPKAPSTGAVTNVLRRFADWGFITVTDEKPFAFVSITPDGESRGVAALRSEAKEAKKAAASAA